MLKYRGATIDDLDQVLSLMAGLYEHEHVELDDRVKSGVQLLLKNPVAGRVFLIELESVTVGYAILTVLFSLEFGGPCGFLDEFFILPEYRGNGLGKQALEYFIDSAEKEGLMAIRLEVNHDNTIAKKLYDSAGFKSQNRDLISLRLPRRDWLKVNGVTE